MDNSIKACDYFEEVTADKEREYSALAWKRADKIALNLSIRHFVLLLASIALMSVMLENKEVIVKFLDITLYTISNATIILESAYNAFMIVLYFIGRQMCRTEIGNGNLYSDKVTYLGKKNGKHIIKKNGFVEFDIDGRLANIDNKELEVGKEYQCFVVARHGTEEVLLVDIIRD